jgi:hypothetical protein
MDREDTSGQRALRARLAAAERWGRTADRAAATAPARRGLRAKFEQAADADGTLPAPERARRADHLMHAHMLRMSLAAAESRRRRATRGGRPGRATPPGTA